MLSMLEAKVLKMRSEGMSYAEMAEKLDIPQWHIKNLLATVRINLGARTTAQAVAISVRQGLI